jgi:hypothetical protein
MLASDFAQTRVVIVAAALALLMMLAAAIGLALALDYTERRNAALDEANAVLLAWLDAETKTGAVSTAPASSLDETRGD